MGRNCSRPGVGGREPGLPPVPPKSPHLQNKVLVPRLWAALWDWPRPPPYSPGSGALLQDRSRVQANPTQQSPALAPLRALPVRSGLEVLGQRAEVPGKELR